MTQGSRDAPRVGWNAVPGDPNALRWWDGTTFTHDARSAGDHWEVVDRGTDTATTTPPRDQRRERVLLGWAVALLGPCLTFFVVLVAVANDPETNSGTGMVVTWLVMLAIGVIGSIAAGIVIARRGRGR